MQADAEEIAALELKKKRTFRKFSYRGIDLDNLLDLTPEQIIDLVHARARRRLSRGIKRKGMALLKKVSERCSWRVPCAVCGAVARMMQRPACRSTMSHIHPCMALAASQGQEGLRPIRQARCR